jgi:Flp pilus assembly protein TadG
MRTQPKAVKDERGMMLIMAGLGLVAFMSATMLALDVGMFMTARSQAQNAADAGALAGAVALYYNDWNDRTPAGPAVQNAITAATNAANHVMSGNVSVQPDDVTFPTVERVQVKVHRTGARNNPLLPFIAPMFGINTVDLGAVATAEAALANAMTCVKPFTIPDKWDERQSPPWDPTDTFDVVDNKGKPLATPDVYIPRTQNGYTGYSSLDIGTRVVIKSANGNNIYPSIYFPYSMGGVTGAAEYEWNIENCNTLMMEFDDLLLAEPGNMVGPTQQGVQDLIAKDPGAFWDSVNDRVVSTMSPSPRVAPIPVFDPQFYDTGKQNGRNADFKVANYIGIFIDRMRGNDVEAIIVPVSGVLKGNGGPATNAFARAIVLVQ